MNTNTGETDVLRLKAITQVGSHQQVVWNPQLALYLVVAGKSIAVNRATDDQRVGAVVLKDPEQAIGYQWEQKTGKKFAVFYRNGLVRVYDCTTTGGHLQKVVNMADAQKGLETKNANLSSAVWATVVWEQFSETYTALDVDLTALMPEMVRIVRDSKQITMAPLECWGPDMRHPEASLILAHSEDDHNYLLTIDGLVSVRFSSKIAHMCKILPPSYKGGPFVGVARDGSLEHVCVSFTKAPLMRELINSSGQVRMLCDYLVENIAVCRSDLIDPYIQFLTRISDAYSGQDLYTQLCEILVSGCVDPALEDWLCNSIGDKNFKRWKQLSTRMYRDLSNVLTLAIVPACERLILECEKLQGIHKSIKLHKMKDKCEFETASWASPKLDTLLHVCQEILQSTLRWISDLNLEAALHTLFADWFFDVVMECVDEDYKIPATHETRSALRLEQYLAACWRNQSATAGVLPLETLVSDQLVTCAANVDELYTKPWISKLIEVSVAAPTIPNVHVWDAVVDDTGTVFTASQSATDRPSTIRITEHGRATHKASTQAWDLETGTQINTTTTTKTTGDSSLSHPEFGGVRVRVRDAAFVTCPQSVAISAALVVLHGNSDNDNAALTTLQVRPSTLLAGNYTLTGLQQQLPRALAPSGSRRRLHACSSSSLLSVHDSTVMAVYEMSCDQV
ncbi:LAME_0G08614g1_1 [Lachancea meyersii CBS 8951]|uniref:Anaphase-promoting complex subunit 4 n=1 Tax=Lachancea meyersii CBS 8951 TaxID=1266667 RepID=A0A1G4K8A6_9SACH|nr:LAME_0G08614g1_1 [Lachancea meyersii CBS 8951]